MSAFHDTAVSLQRARRLSLPVFTSCIFFSLKNNYFVFGNSTVILSTFQSLLKHMQFMIAFRILQTVLGNFPDSMQNGCMVGVPRTILQFQEDFSGSALWSGTWLPAGAVRYWPGVFGIHVSYLDPEKISDSFLDIFNGNLPVLYGQQVFKGFFREFDRDIPSVKA